MGKCSVKSCTSRSETHNKTRGITFHKVPKDPVRRDKWIKVIRLLRKETDWIPTKTTIICSKHFRDRDKIAPKSEDGRVSLCNEAIPVLVDEPNPTEQVEPFQVENIDIDWIDDVETDEEMEEIIESPQQHKMRLIINRLKLTSKERLKKIKKFQQKNKRLEKKNIKLQAALEELKKKYAERIRGSAAKIK